MRRRAEHGTRGKYVAGCRCDPCTAANAEYQRAYMAARYVPATDRSYHGYRRNDGGVTLGLEPLTGKPPGRPRRAD